MKSLILIFLLIPFMSVMAMAQASAPKADNQPNQQKEVTVAAEILNKYAGVYRLDENFQVTISVENNKLYALAPGDQEKTEFTATSATKFYMKGSGAEIEFVEENGQRFLLVKMQQVMKLTKIS
ncbi:DUF3471 domain-containing protein [Adhaeribacter aerolatus]|nr:DUF3471 domain-containing protein [Adhaeribacter aerolatus]